MFYFSFFLCFSGAAKCIIESTWQCFDWVMHNRRHVALFTLVIKSKPRSPKSSRALCCVVWITEDRCCVGLIDFFLGRSKHIQRKAHAFRGRPTLKEVERELLNGSFSDLN